MAKYTLKVNGRTRTVDVDADTIPEIPKVEIALIHRPGTPACCAIPAAIANAVFDATGARLRSVPFTPDKVKAALARS